VIRVFAWVSYASRALAAIRFKGIELLSQVTRIGIFSCFVNRWINPSGGRSALLLQPRLPVEDNSEWHPALRFRHQEQEALAVR
jgi:hypothetical protein